MVLQGLVALDRQVVTADQVHAPPEAAVLIADIRGVIADEPNLEQRRVSEGVLALAFGLDGGSARHLLDQRGVEALALFRFLADHHAALADLGQGPLAAVGVRGQEDLEWNGPGIAAKHRQQRGDEG